MVYDVDFKTGKIRWQHELLRGVPRVQRHIKNSFASETPVTDGERVYVYFGSIGVVAALDLNGKPVWTKELAALDGRQAFGTAASPALHKDRLIVVNDNATESFIAAFNKSDGRGAVARQARGGRELGDAVRLGERAAHRDRHRGSEQGSLVRSGRQAAVGALGHDGERRADAVRQARAGVHQLGLPGRVAAAGVRHPSRRVGRHLAQAGRDSNEFIVLVPAAARAPTTRRRSSTATTITRCSIAGSCCATTRGPASRSTVASGSRRRRAGSPRRPGRTTARSFC